MKTANLAIMFTDIVGYTAGTAQRSRAEQAEWQQRHEQLLLPAFKAFGGKVVKTIGDAFLVTFASPTDAVLCGTAIQDLLARHNHQAQEQQVVRVRVVINMGEVRREHGDIFGEPVNIAARIEGLAQAGEVLFTEAVFLAMNKSEIKSEPRGEHELKGIPIPVRVHQVLTQHQGPGELPYGGQALGRVDTGSWPKLPDEQALAAAVKRTGGWLRRARPALGVGAMVLLAGLSLWQLWPRSNLAEALAAVDAEHWELAEQGIAQLSLDQGDPSSQARAARAYLHSARGQGARAMRLYRQAFAVDRNLCTQDLLMQDVAAYLEDRRDEARTILKLCPKDRRIKALQHVVRDSDRSNRGRIEAAWMLSQDNAGERDELRALATALLADHGPCSVRRRAVQVLGYSGTRADLPLLQALGDRPAAQADDPLQALAAVGKQISHAAANACMGSAPREARAQIAQRH